MIIRVDDYPGTKPEEFWKHNIENFLKFDDLMSLYQREYHLGVIPRHTSVEELQTLGSLAYCRVVLHGIDHDERFPNEFREYETEDEITMKLIDAKVLFERYVGYKIDTYIPPHNMIDIKTVRALARADFKKLWGGPGSDIDILKGTISKFGITSTYFQDPYFYGRTDEMMERGAVEKIRHFFDLEIPIGICLHWPWEFNIGLESLERFLSKLDGVI